MRAGRVALALVVGAVTAVMPASAHATFPGPNGRIAFSDGTDIGLVDPAGGDRMLLTSNAGNNHEPAWSADAQQIAFSSDRDGNKNIYVLDVATRAQTRVTNLPGDEDNPTWSPDGQKIAFDYTVGGVSDIYVVNADGTGLTNITTGQGGVEPSWSADGQKIAFLWGNNVFTMGPDGSARTRVTNYAPDTRDSYHDPGNPNWSPDSQKIAFDLLYGGGGYFFNALHVIHADGSGDTEYYFGDNGFPSAPAFSPDGNFLTYGCNGALCIMSLADGWQSGHEIADSTPGGGPDWEPGLSGPDPPGYPRPRGATPLRLPLVPEYNKCIQPANRVHGSPLAWPSCAPPKLRSNYATLGTPDANGQPANGNGYVLFKTVPGDVRIKASITDVRKQSDLSDYTGHLTLMAILKVTDTDNSSGYSDAPSPATMPTSNIQADMLCAPTPSSSVGSTCAVDTTDNAILPGAVKAGARSIWELIDLFVRDGGPDGSGSTSTVFLDAGVFVP